MSALGREADIFDKAVEAQRGFFLMPLSAYLQNGLAYKRSGDRTLMLLYESKAPEDIRWFDELGDAMQKRLPASTDSTDELIRSFQQIGLSVGKGFQWQGLDDATKRGLARAAQAGELIVDAKWASTGEITNGWKYTFAGGRAGYDPALRAALAKYEVGAQLSDQVVLWRTARFAIGCNAVDFYLSLSARANGASTKYMCEIRKLAVGAVIGEPVSVSHFPDGRENTGKF